MKIFGKELVLTKGKVKQILAVVTIVGAIGWGVYSFISGTSETNPIPEILAPAHEVLQDSTIGDTLIK